MVQEAFTFLRKKGKSRKTSVQKAFAGFEASTSMENKVRRSMGAQSPENNSYPSVVIGLTEGVCALPTTILSDVVSGFSGNSWLLLVAVTGLDGPPTGKRRLCGGTEIKFH